MTDEVRDILQRELTRCALALTEMDPAREHKSYGELVNTVQSLIWITTAPDTASPSVGVEQEPYSPAEIKVIPAEEMTEEDKADAAAVIEAAEEAKTYSREEVRAALAKSRKNGVNVTELLAKFGVDNFSALPAAKYPELMARLGES